METTTEDGQHWACPFYRIDPFAHFSCLKYRLNGLSRVLQHLERCHCVETLQSSPTCGPHLDGEAVRDAPNSLSQPKPKQGMITRGAFNAAKIELAKLRSEEAKWEGLWVNLFGEYKMPDSLYIKLDMTELASALCRKNKEGVLEVLALALGHEPASLILEPVLQAAYNTSPNNQHCGFASNLHTRWIAPTQWENVGGTIGDVSAFLSRLSAQPTHQSMNSPGAPSSGSAASNQSPGMSLDSGVLQGLPSTYNANTSSSGLGQGSAFSPPNGFAGTQSTNIWEGFAVVENDSFDLGSFQSLISQKRMPGLDSPHDSSHFSFEEFNDDVTVRNMSHDDNGHGILFSDLQPDTILPFHQNGWTSLDSRL